MKANLILILLALIFFLPNSQPSKIYDNLQIQIDLDKSDLVIEENTIESCKSKIAQQIKTKRPVKNLIKRLRKR